MCKSIIVAGLLPILACVAAEVKSTGQSSASDSVTMTNSVNSARRKVVQPLAVPVSVEGLFPLEHAAGTCSNVTVVVENGPVTIEHKPFIPIIEGPVQQNRSRKEWYDVFQAERGSKAYSILCIAKEKADAGESVEHLHSAFMQLITEWCQEED